MKKLTLLSAAVAIFTAQTVRAAVALDPQSVDLEPFRFVPTLVTELKQDSNIYGLSTNEVSSFITVIAPTFRLVSQDRDNSYTAQYGLVAGLYGESNNNYFDNIFNVNAHIEPTGRFRFDLGAGYSLLHDDVGTARTEGLSAAALGKLDPDEYTLVGLNGALEYGAQDAAGQIGLNLGYNQKRYDLTAAADLRDIDTLSGVLEFRLRIMPKTKLLLDLEHSKGEYSNNAIATELDYTESAYLLGVSWESSASTTGKVRLGNRKRETDGGSRTKFTWDAGVVWTPLERDKITIDGSQRFSDGTFPTVGIDSTTLALGWAHDWTERWQTSATAALTKDDYVMASGSGARDDETTSLGLAVNYQMRRWLILGGGATLRDRSSSVSAYEYDRQVVSLNAQVSL